MTFGGAFHSGNYGQTALDRRSEAHAPSVEGARASLESFYHAFNQRRVDVLADIWAPDALASLYNPVGGVIRDRNAIVSLYERIFTGPARVSVELIDVVEYVATDTVLFAGREVGECVRGTERLVLAIRTSRFFHYYGAATGWRQVHHHGSIDDPETLRAYQEAVSSPLRLE